MNFTDLLKHVFYLSLEQPQCTTSASKLCYQTEYMGTYHYFYEKSDIHGAVKDVSLKNDWCIQGT